MTTFAPNFQSIDVTAERYNVSPRTIRRLIHNGTINPLNIGSKIVRIDVNETDSIFRRASK